MADSKNEFKPIALGILSQVIYRVLKNVLKLNMEEYFSFSRSHLQIMEIQ